MKKVKEGATILVQSEFEDTRFYRVLFGKMRKDDRCQCGGVKQYLGRKKNGEPKYRMKYSNCFHIQWARECWQEGKEVLYAIKFT